MSIKCKLFCISLMMIFVLLFSSCARKEAQNEDRPPEPAMDLVKSYTDYCELTENKKISGHLPDDFIPYDETWGTFYSFCYTPPVFAYYDYRYTTSDGTEVFLRISSVHRLLDYELNDGSKDYSSKKPVNRNDMRDFGKKIMGVYVFDDTIRYYYGVSDESIGYGLVSVSWVSGTHYIRYYFGSPTDAIDMNADSFEAKLLNLDTAVAAITERFGEPKNIKELIKQR